MFGIACHILYTELIFKIPNPNFAFNQLQNLALLILFHWVSFIPL